MLENNLADSAWAQLLADLSARWPVARWKNLGVVVGCSGGADSVALLRAIGELRKLDELRKDDELRKNGASSKGFVIAAHYNHALRGDDSDADQQSVAELAESLGVSFVTERAPGAAPDDEAGMRSLRRDFFLRAAQRSGARYIATGHTADDNVETVLHHLMRGTGPAGIAGIAPHVSIGPGGDPDSDLDREKDFVLVRPMLGLRGTFIRDGLRSIGQAWREDASNENTDYRRNWIRHELIPRIETQYPCAVDAMSRTIEIQNDWRNLVDGLASTWLQEKQRGANPTCLDFDQVTQPAIIIAALQQLWDARGWPRREMATKHWRRLADTVQSASPTRYSVPGHIDVVATPVSVTLTRR